MKTLFTAIEAAVELNVDVTRVQTLCRRKRLGYTVPRHGRAWVITLDELNRYRETGPLKAGRPRKKPAATAPAKE